MLKIICLSHDKRWNHNIMNMIENYPKNICVVFESSEDREQFIHEIEEVNNKRGQALNQVPIEFESMIVPTDHSLLHRRLKVLKNVIEILPLSDEDKVMFIDEDDNCRISRKLLDYKDDSINIIQLYRLDYHNVEPDNVIRNWTTIKDNEWIHYTIHSLSFKMGIMHSYNYNFTGKLFSVRLIRMWLNECWNILINLDPLMEQEDLIMSTSLVNLFPNIMTGGIDNSIYYYNYVSKNRQDPSKCKTITDFLKKRLDLHVWGLTPFEEFPLKNKGISVVTKKHQGSMVYQYKDRCVLQRSYDYPWEAQDINYTSYAYSVVYNSRMYTKEDLYKIAIEKSKKYDLNLVIMEDL